MRLVAELARAAASVVLSTALAAVGVSVRPSEFVGAAILLFCLAVGALLPALVALIATAYGPALTDAFRTEAVLAMRH